MYAGLSNLPGFVQRNGALAREQSLGLSATKCVSRYLCKRKWLNGVDLCPISNKIGWTYVRAMSPQKKMCDGRCRSRLLMGATWGGQNSPTMTGCFCGQPQTTSHFGIGGGGLGHMYTTAPAALGGIDFVF